MPQGTCFVYFFVQLSACVEHVTSQHPNSYTKLMMCHIIIESFFIWKISSYQRLKRHDNYDGTQSEFLRDFFRWLERNQKKKDAKSSLQAFGCFFSFFYFYYYFFFIKQPDLKQVVDNWFDNGLCRKHCQHSGLCLRSYWPKFV